MTNALNLLRIIKLQQIDDARGSLTVFEDLSPDTIPTIERIYYLHNLSNNSERGAHAHKDLVQLMIPISGSFTVTLEKNHQTAFITLNDPSKALLIMPGTWRNITDFSEGAICLVLASKRYDESDYVRDLHLFRKMTDERYW